MCSGSAAHREEKRNSSSDQDPAAVVAVGDRVVGQVMDPVDLGGGQREVAAGALVAN
jgi:hypothetical protein